MLFPHLPLLGNALPACFMLFAYLAVGVVVALWVQENLGRSRTRTLLLLALATIFWLPSWPFPQSRLTVPQFFAQPALHQKYLPRNALVLVVPVAYGGHATAMLWQAETNMYFKMPEGYAISPGGFGTPANSLTPTLADMTRSAGPSPPETMSPLTQALDRGAPRGNHVAAAVVGPTTPGLGNSLFKACRHPPAGLPGRGQHSARHRLGSP